MKNIFIARFFVVVASLFFVWSCGAVGPSTPTNEPVSVEFLQAGSESVPHISGSIIEASIADYSLGQKAGEVDSDVLDFLQDFFKAECHNDDNSINFCPTGTEPSDDNKFTMDTMIGTIYHAHMALADIYQSDDASYMTCSKGDNASELTNNTPVYDPSNSNEFILDFGTLFECTSSISREVPSYYYIYSKSVEGTEFGEVYTRKQSPSTVGGEEITMSDIFQPYLRKDSAGDNYVVAFNFAAYHDKESGNFGTRIVLLLNVQSHRFITKRLDNSNNSLIALGEAGYDTDTKLWVEGYYMARVRLSQQEESTDVCMLNNDITSVVEDSNCSGFSGFLSETGWTIDEVYAWLGITSTTDPSLSGFDIFLENADELSESELPQNSSDYFPDSISAQ